MTREIPVTDGKVALVDDADYESLMQWKWHGHAHGRYAVRSTPRTTGPRGSVLMHREILGVASDVDVDHIDGNGLNNQRANLRACTHRQNMWNTTGRARSSEFKGVHFEKARGMWRAQINVNGNQRQIGRFATEVEAAHAYDKQARLAFGEFARVNFPVGTEQCARVNETASIRSADRF